MALTPSQRALLQNRYSVAKYRAVQLHAPFPWPTFRSWLEEVIRQAPDGEDLSKMVVRYDKEGKISLHWPSKRVAKQMQKVEKALKVSTEDRKILFAVELMQRIMTPGPEELREKIMSAAEVAGIDLP